MDFQRQGFGAEAIAKFVQDRTEVHVRYWFIGNESILINIYALDRRFTPAKLRGTRRHRASRHANSRPPLHAARQHRLPLQHKFLGLDQRGKF